jgi:hypothetical protein
MGPAAFLLILESGAGGYVTKASRKDACQVVANMGSNGWLFRFRAGGHLRGWKRGGPITELVLVAAVGSPDGNAMADALLAAGKRHGVLYQIDLAGTHCPERCGLVADPTDSGVQ